MHEPNVAHRPCGQGPRWPQGPWPDDAQRLLLRACLLDDDTRALAAWHEWRLRVPLDDLDAGSNCLLPLAYRRLGQGAAESEDYERIKGVARHHWARHQWNLESLRGVLSELAGAGIETLLLKGAALGLAVYPFGSRPMFDLDVVVPRALAQRAIEVLRENGWRSSTACPERLIDVVHGCQFKAGPQRLLDLHWDFFHGRVLSADEQAPFWKAAETVSVAEARTRVLAPTHQLLHTCVHGARYCPAPPLRWLADASLIVRKLAGRIDWDELVGLAERLELTPYVHSTLAWLADELEVAIPPTALRALGRARTSWSARLEFHFAVRKMPGSHPFWRTLPFHLVGYARNRRRMRRMGLGEYLRLQHHWEQPLSHHLRHLWALPIAGTQEALGAWLRGAWRWAIGASEEHALDMGSAQPCRLQHFYNVEVAEGRLFRWSDVEASVRFADFTPADCHVVARLAPVRNWHSDLARHLTIAFDGRPIPVDQMAFVQGCLRFRIVKEMFAAGRAHALTFRCRALAVANGDTRRLGVPIASIRITPQPGEGRRSAA